MSGRNELNWFGGWRDRELFAKVGKNEGVALVILVVVGFISWIVFSVMQSKKMFSKETIKDMLVGEKGDKEMLDVPGIIIWIFTSLFISYMVIVHLFGITLKSSLVLWSKTLLHYLVIAGVCYGLFAMVLYVLRIKLSASEEKKLKKFY